MPSHAAKQPELAGQRLGNARRGSTSGFAWAGSETAVAFRPIPLESTRATSASPRAGKGRHEIAGGTAAPPGCRSRCGSGSRRALGAARSQIKGYERHSRSAPRLDAAAVSALGIED